MVMTKNQIFEFVSSDPEIMHGKPCIKGTRIPVSLVVSMIADDMTIDEILNEYPSLTIETIKVALKYASLTCEYETVAIC